MKKQQAGFTLIELVVVIVLLGILGAAATARFQDLSAEANAAALTAVASEIQSGSAINFAKRSITPTAGFAIDNCDDSASLMQTGSLPAGYTVAAAACAAGSATCTLTQTSTTNTTTFNLICIP